MAKRKKVLVKPDIDEEAIDQALRCCIDEADDGFVTCSPCPYTMHGMSCSKSLMQDVQGLLQWYRALLKQREVELSVLNHQVAELRSEIRDHIDGAEFACFQSVKDFAERCMKRFSVGSEARTVIMRELRNYM